MTSLRAFSATCLGIRVGSVLRDFFGYASPPPWSLAPAGDQASLPHSLSVKVQLQRLRNQHFSLDVIRVGTDASGRFSAADEQNVDCAVQIARETYAAAGLGIGRVNRSWVIPLSWNTGYDVIEDHGEAGELVGHYSAPGRGLDVFFVLAILDDFAGTRPWDWGHLRKGDGIVVDSNTDSFRWTGRHLAHEIGHLLGLGHENGDRTNLMCQAKRGMEGFPESSHLNIAQISLIRAISRALDPPC